ncbi:MAG TPA: hypothetical protein VII52_09340 [Gemmatimonadaceae bacterium]
MRGITRRFALGTTAILLDATACIPYTVGSTAQTAPTGQTTHATSTYFVPNAFRRPGDTISTPPLVGVDQEWRHGLDAQSDIGLRLPSVGAVVDYKHRFRDYEPGSPALAYVIGGGIVNAGEHALFEATVIASGDETAQATPFGGVRAMQVAPISQGALHDSPTIGAFAGVQVGDATFRVRPELGVFYDRSALRLRPGNFIFVPAITVQRAPRQTARGTNAPPATPPIGPPPSGLTAKDVLRCLLGLCPRPGR